MHVSKCSSHDLSQPSIKKHLHVHPLTSLVLSNSFCSACLAISTSMIFCRSSSFSSSARLRLSSTLSSSLCKRTDTSLATWDHRDKMLKDKHMQCKDIEQNGYIHVLWYVPLTHTIYYLFYLFIYCISSRYHLIKHPNVFSWLTTKNWILRQHKQFGDVCLRLLITYYGFKYQYYSP